MTNSIDDIFEVVRISSADPRARGHLLGEAARDRIHESRAAYEETFDYFTGLSWEKVTTLAMDFAEPIGNYDAAILEEIEGIAEGCGLALGDLLAINARSEIMFGLKVSPAPECRPPQQQSQRPAPFPRPESGNNRQRPVQNPSSNPLHLRALCAANPRTPAYKSRIPA